MASEEDVLDVVVRAFEEETGVSACDPKKATIDDPDVSAEIRKVVHREFGITAWPKDGETVQEYADRVVKEIGRDTDDEEDPQPLNF